LREAFNNAIKEYDKIWLELSIPAADKSFAARLKRPLHQLVLFYVNRIGQKQIKFNDRMLRIVNHLVTSEEKKENEIKELQERLAHLQKRIEELEQDQS
jgi:lipid II:glycine glycyltransferase (peptidoglycan interpeptide bridge formation enzyme)